MGNSTQYDEFNKFNTEYFNNLIDLINKAKKLAKENISDIEAISNLGEGWVAEETFAIAIYSCLKYPNKFQDAIVCSINHDGDSDSTGAITGNIIGAYLGYNTIPRYYKNNIELKDIILELADDMSVQIPVSEYSNTNDKYWLSKYLYCQRDKTLKQNKSLKQKKLNKYINKLIDKYKPTPPTKENEEFEYYCKLYEKKFRKKATR